jgi:hypothetical protein
MSDKPKKSNRTLQRCLQDWTRIIETLYDLLDSGKSFEELAIYFKIGAAGGAIPEELGEIVHDALEEMTKAREAGLNRNEVLAYMRAAAKR